ncbi:MAG TPA: ParB/RepB/Spo0J family partition protein [Ktedonobacteraceae bacterium]|nr:ParB/RepB/Spo0J family partition protein [Ktedonobacteraceae bacterium]
MPEKPIPLSLLEPPPEMSEEELHAAILRRLGVEEVPTHVPAWIPLTSLLIPDEETVRVPGWLVDSIGLLGILQAPSVVRTSQVSEEGPLFEVIAGRRRTMAARILGLAAINVEVYSHSTPGLSAMIALTENSQRQKAWKAELKYLRVLVSQKVDLSERELIASGFPRRSLRERLKMALLPAPLLEELISGPVSLAVARKLVRLSPSQLARVSDAARHERLTADLVKQALKVQMSATLSTLPVSWEMPLAAAPITLPECEDQPGSLQDLLGALRAFCQGPDYQRVEEAHLLIQALQQQLEIAVRETSLSAQAS